MRHGQAMHNVEGDKNPEALLSPNLFDAQLSPLGLQQVLIIADIRVSSSMLILINPDLNELNNKK